MKRYDIFPAPARQTDVPNVIRNPDPNETWTVPDRNRVNDGTVTVITALHERAQDALTQKQLATRC